MSMKLEYKGTEIPFRKNEETKKDDLFINANGEVFCKTEKIATIIRHSWLSRVSGKIRRWAES